MTPEPRDPLNAAALRATAGRPGYVGYWLARHRTTESLTADGLAAKLGTDARGLALLALCQSPREETFAKDVEVVATRAGADRAALANLLRQEQNLAAWAADGPSPPCEPGWLLAAHDADQPPPGEDDP